MFVKLSKCRFGCVEVNYLRHLVSMYGLRVKPTKLNAISDWLVPTFIKSLRGFLRLMGYYRKFIRGYENTFAPLTALLMKNNFEWLVEAEETFKKLKMTVSKPPVLAQPNFTKSFVIECGASGIGTGAVLI